MKNSLVSNLSQFNGDNHDLKLSIFDFDSNRRFCRRAQFYTPKQTATPALHSGQACIHIYNNQRPEGDNAPSFDPYASYTHFYVQTPFFTGFGDMAS